MFDYDIECMPKNIIDDTENIWHINISQPNDIFIYISRKEETDIIDFGVIFTSYVP